MSSCSDADPPEPELDHVIYLDQASCPAQARLATPLQAQFPPTTSTWNKRYSIYTDSHFWDERGISLVTTDQVIDTDIKDALKRHYRKEIALRVEHDAYERRHIDGKGDGLVAKRYLPKGALLIWEPPTLIVHLDAHQHLSKQVRLRTQTTAVDVLSSKAKSDTLALMGHWGGDAVEDRLDTNSFVVSLGGRMNHHALFTETSRLNHACRANCFYQWDRRSLTHKVYTVQDVEPGQELTISYIVPIATHAERQRSLQTWGFNCTCATCSLPEAARKSSDDSIGLIREYTEALQDWSNNGRATPDMAEKLVDLYRQERLFAEIAEGFQLASYAYNAVRDRYNALRMANMAIDFGLQTWREMGIRINETLQFMMDPEAHWTWGKRG